MDRRSFLIAGSTLVAAACEIQADNVPAPARAAMPSSACVPTIRLTPGPYGLPTSPARADIREDRPGVPLHLRMRVVDDYFCRPMKGAKVEIWQSDASGLYSGVENIQFDMRTMDPLKEVVDLRGKEFLRGHQISNDEGYVDFSTIFPGWYTGRLPHIHVRTFIDDVAWMTHDTQLFFPADVENQVFQSDTYKARGPNTVALARDLVLRGDQRALKALTVTLKKATEGYEGDMTLAVTL